MAGYFLGMLASDEGNADGAQGHSWRNGYRMHMPNGGVSIVALTSLMPTERVYDPQHNWFDKIYNYEVISLQGNSETVPSKVFNKADDASANAVSTVSAGDFVFFKVKADSGASSGVGKRESMDIFYPGSRVLATASADTQTEIYTAIWGTVRQLIPNGDASYIGVQVTKAYDSSDKADGVTKANAAKLKTLTRVGSAFPEGSTRPEAVRFIEDRRYNYTQIQRTALDLTRTRLRTRYRTETDYNSYRREQLDFHMRSLENQFLFEDRWEGVGSNGKRQSTCGGLKYWADNYGRVFDFKEDTKTGNKNGLPAAPDWNDGGYYWLQWAFEQLGEFGDKPRMAYMGPQAEIGINNLAYEKGHINISPGQTPWGTSVGMLQGLGVEAAMKVHPLFRATDERRRMMLVFAPSLLRYIYIDDTMFEGGGYESILKAHTDSGYDGVRQAWLTEASLQIDIPEILGVFYNVGIDNN